MTITYRMRFLWYYIRVSFARCYRHQVKCTFCCDTKCCPIKRQAQLAGIRCRQLCRLMTVGNTLLLTSEPFKLVCQTLCFYSLYNCDTYKNFACFQIEFRHFRANCDHKQLSSVLLEVQWSWITTTIKHCLMLEHGANFMYVHRKQTIYPWRD